MHFKGIIIYIFCISFIFIYLIVRYAICADKDINPKYKRIIGYSALLALIVGFIIGRSIMWFSPRILVIEPNKSHHYEYAIFDFQNDFRIRSIYLKNDTDTDLCLKKHVYTTKYSRSGHDEFKTIICPSHDIIKIMKVPDYFFEDAPSFLRFASNSRSTDQQLIRWEINDH